MKFVSFQNNRPRAAISDNNKDSRKAKPAALLLANKGTRLFISGYWVKKYSYAGLHPKMRENYAMARAGLAKS